MLEMPVGQLTQPLGEIGKHWLYIIVHFTSRQQYITECMLYHSFHVRGGGAHDATIMVVRIEKFLAIPTGKSRLTRSILSKRGEVDRHCQTEHCDSKALTVHFRLFA